METEVNVYTERAHLVATLSKLWPASLEVDPAEPGWLVCIIDSPMGQLSWHIAPDDLPLFSHLHRNTGRVWDGHTTEEKYARLASLPQSRGGSHFGRVMGELNPGLKPLIDAMQQDQEELIRAADVKRAQFRKERDEQARAFDKRWGFK